MFKNYIVGIVVGALLGATVMLFVYPRVTDQHTTGATFYVNEVGDIVKYVDVNGVTRFGDTDTSTDGLTAMQDTSNLYVESGRAHYTTSLDYRSNFGDHTVVGVVPVVFEGEAYDMISAYNFINVGMSSWSSGTETVNLAEVIFDTITRHLEGKYLSATWTGETVIHTDPDVAASYAASGRVGNYNFLCRELPVTLDRSVSSILNGTLHGMLEGNINVWETTPEPCGIASPEVAPPTGGETESPQGGNN